MEVFNNTTKVVRDDLIKTIQKGSRISVAAACFSIYAYQELKNLFSHHLHLSVKSQKRKNGNFIFLV